MQSIILYEYRDLVQRKSDIEATLDTLPQGYISVKHINGKAYRYLQHRSGGKVISKYLKPDIADEVAAQLIQRKEMEMELPRVCRRMREIEQAAAVLSRELYAQLSIIKYSAGMDELPSAQKKRSVTFSNAMTSLEGAPVSRETKSILVSWGFGESSFSAIMEQTLRRYGFITEV